MTPCNSQADCNSTVTATTPDCSAGICETRWSSDGVNNKLSEVGSTKGSCYTSSGSTMLFSLISLLMAIICLNMWKDWDKVSWYQQP